MNPRYLIGISLPDELSHAIEKIQEDILDGENVMQPLVPHITLMHPSLLATLSPLYFLPQAKNVAQDSLPITIKLLKTAMFDRRVLYIAVMSDDLSKLQKNLIELLPSDVKSRYEVGRHFLPHITVAQAMPMQSLSEDLVTRLNAKLSNLLPATFAVHNLTKFDSSGPRIYKPKSI